MAGPNPDLIIRVAANIAALQADMAAAVATIKSIEGAATATAGATAKLAGESDGLGSSWVARIAEGVLLRDAIRGVLSELQQLVVGIPNEARELRNLSLQTQVNVEDLQVLSAATREYGVDGDQLGKALFQLGQRIAGGDASVATAYHLMGMSLDEVRDKDPLERFLLTEKGLGTLSGAIQDTAAKDLYGGRLGASLIAFSHGAEEAVAKARALNTVASKESVEAAAAYADAIDRATHSVHAWFMELEGKAAQGFNVLTDSVDKGASTWQLSKAMLADWVASTISAGGSATNLATLLDHLNQKANEGKDIVLASAKAHDVVTVALTAHEQAARFMAATELDSAKPLLAWQVEYLSHLKDIGLLTAQNAAGIGVNADQFRNYTAAVEAAKKAEAEADAMAMTALTNRIKSLQVLTAESLKAYSFTGQIAQLQALDAAEQALTRAVYDSLTSEKDRMKVIEEASTRHIELMKQETAIQTAQAQVVNAAIVAEFDAQAKLNAEWGLTASGAIALQVTAADKLRLALDALHLTKVAGISQAAQEQVLMDAYTRALYDEAIADEQATLAAQQHNAELAKVPGLTIAASDGIHALAMASSAASISAAAVNQFADTIEGRLKLLAATQSSGQFINTSGLFAGLPHRASGGPTSANTPYIVGERGPELFVPQSAGSIVPNGGGGSSHITNHIYVTTPLGTPAAIAKAVDEALMARSRNSGARMPVGA